MSFLRGGFCVWHSAETQRNVQWLRESVIQLSCKHLHTLQLGPYEWKIPQLHAYSSARHMDEHLLNDNPNI